MIEKARRLRDRSCARCWKIESRSFSLRICMKKTWRTPFFGGLNGNPMEDEHSNSLKANHCKLVMAKICITKYLSEMFQAAKPVLRNAMKNGMAANSAKMQKTITAVIERSYNIPISALPINQKTP